MNLDYGSKGKYKYMIVCELSKHCWFIYGTDKTTFENICSDTIRISKEEVREEVYESVLEGCSYLDAMDCIAFDFKSLVEAKNFMEDSKYSERGVIYINNNGHSINTEYLNTMRTYNKSGY